MWIVIITPGANFGRVGQVDRNAYEDHNRDRGRKVQVQLGNSGPFVHYLRNMLLPVAPVVEQIERLTGSRYEGE